ncbi:MAG TPA: carbamoyltransferase [Chthoniobacterales bacterium]|nr:carbamoyltransferase [Chthoniobacterales bacterium]
MTSILGISAFYHDSAAALICDGEIVAAAQEERFSRRKHDPGFPRLAIEYCLREGKIHPRDLDAVAFYEKPMVKFERLLETYLAYAPDGFASFREALPLWADLKLDLSGKIQRELGPEFKGQLYFTDHHEAHGASAFFPSPFERAAILTLDAVGEWSTSSVGVGQGNRIALKEEMKFPHSLGMLYSAFTYYTGFKVNSGEYKLMGLAPYGKPKYADLIREKIVAVKDDGSIWLDMSFFNYCQGLTMTSDKFHQLFGGPPRQPESFITQKEMDLAASIQLVCEEVVLRAGEHAHRQTGEANLVMAGGVALNCVANGRLLREGPFEKIWIQPAAGDAGGALGAALLVWHHVLDKPRRTQLPDAQKGSLLGPQFDSDDIQLFLDSMGAAYDRIEDESKLLERIAGELDEGKVIGWFQGRMEFGPRALGSRSIIGDARSPEMQQKMNLKIKYRESFRPFAPCVLHDFAHQVFDMQPGEESPYMLHVAPIRDSWRVSLTEDDKKRMADPDLRVRVSVPRSRLPAITHVDYSARIQTIDPDRHGRYYRLMRKFHEMTGCPVIVNTSFNIRGEPIVGSPEEAFHCFLATEMDVLVLENCVLSKQDQDPASLADAEAYKAQYALD